MATPTTNFGFSSLNTEILQRTSTTSIGLNDAAVRLGYGATSQVSLSDLRRAYGATVTCGSFSSKFLSLTGYSSAFGPTGSIDDNVINVSSPNATLNGVYSIVGGNTLASLETTASPFLGSQCQRFATVNTQRTITGNTAEANFIDIGTSYTFPSSGTVTIGLKWTV
jgi:hypothetical protein